MNNFRPKEKILNLSQVEKYVPINREMEKINHRKWLTPVSCFGNRRHFLTCCKLYVTSVKKEQVYCERKILSKRWTQNFFSYLHCLPRMSCSSFCFFQSIASFSLLYATIFRYFLKSKYKVVVYIQTPYFFLTLK